MCAFDVSLGKLHHKWEAKRETPSDANQATALWTFWALPLRSDGLRRPIIFG